MPSVDLGRENRWAEISGPDEECFNSDASDAWERLVLELQPGAKKQVEAAVKTWNAIVREQLRDETGFRFSHQGRRVTVPVKVTDGLPLRLQNVLQDPQDRLWAKLQIRSAMFDATHRGIKQTKILLGDIRRLVDGSKVTSEDIDGFALVESQLNRLNIALRNRPLPDIILRIDEDVLGAYYPGTSKARIFWLPIALLAASLSLPIEGLAVVVLTHELAHAYTHLGFDIDGRTWATSRFCETDPKVVEGLAQYYTETVCENLRSRLPSATKSFEALLEKQDVVYKAYQEWPETRSGEDMRNFLLRVSERTENAPFLIEVSPEELDSENDYPSR